MIGASHSRPQSASQFKTIDPMSRELKIEAARAALALVTDEMKLGIGTGSTAEEFVRLLAERVGGGLKIIGIPTSIRTQELCNELGVPTSTLEEHPQLDLVVDGTDEVDAAFNLIKGGGGALLREKIVAYASQRMVVIADDSKFVETLGQFPLPIEVNPFGLEATQIALQSMAEKLKLSGTIVLREVNSKTFITDGGHYILDASFGRIPDAVSLSKELLEIPGVVEHGLFLGYAKTVFLAGSQGIKRLDAEI